MYDEFGSLTWRKSVMKPQLSPYTRNRVHAVATQNLRRSGASGVHAAGPKRQRTRRASEKAAIRFSATAG